MHYRPCEGYWGISHNKSLSGNRAITKKSKIRLIKAFHYRMQYLLLLMQDVMDLMHKRDGPFDIQGGGGWHFSTWQVIFFFLFAEQVIFSKVNLNKFCFRKQHLKNQKNVTESNTFIKKPLFLFDR